MNFREPAIFPGMTTVQPVSPGPLILPDREENLSRQISSAISNDDHFTSIENDRPRKKWLISSQVDRTAGYLLAALFQNFFF